jgi:NAD(P)-dependent dehydrogenase (short-subunit alcohol dehydrogenase family)
MRLKKKVCVITGAASGMGRAMARQFAEEGVLVVARDWHEERLSSAIASIEAEGGKITGFAGNIADHQHSPSLLGSKSPLQTG